MASASTSRNRDVEAQQGIVQHRRASYHLARPLSLTLRCTDDFWKELGEGVILETTSHSSEMAGDANGPAQPVVLESQAEGAASFLSSLLPKCDTTDYFMNTRQRRCKS